MYTEIQVNKHIVLQRYIIRFFKENMQELQ